eukprot:3869109-Rhodomonas_salina.1
MGGASRGRREIKCDRALYGDCVLLDLISPRTETQPAERLGMVVVVVVVWGERSRGRSLP